jgi:hypothetical protein
VREAAIFGIFGGYVNVTDGRYVYMRAPATADNQPLHEYVLMPTRQGRGFYPVELIKQAVPAPPFSFTKGCPTMRIPAGPSRQKYRLEGRSALLYDLKTDPTQATPIDDAQIEQRMLRQMIQLMQACDAPIEQYQRLGVEQLAFR